MSRSIEIPCEYEPEMQAYAEYDDTKADNHVNFQTELTAMVTIEDSSNE